MIDFHSHILPKMDDGSKSVEESLNMLRILKSQGIHKVVATPHFYANHNSVDQFLNRRTLSYNSLTSSLTSDLPEIFLGAEVKYYEGISRLENINKLMIGNSKLLLLEMSMRKWTEYTLRELIELSSTGEMTVVLAHIERYLRFQDKEVINNLVKNGLLVQANADFFNCFGTRHKAMTMLSHNLIHFIGSDCHDLQNRPPKIGTAYSYIKRKAGKDLLLRMDELAQRFL